MPKTTFARLSAPTQGGLVVPHAPKISQRLLGRLVFLVERGVTATLRCAWRDQSGLGDVGKTRPVIFCLWHNRLAISMLVHRRYGRKLTALVSASRDGALLSAVLGAFGVAQVRGSSSRRGPQALLELTGCAESGSDVAVTPDGPRGPRYVVQKGIIGLAQVTGLPIIAVGCRFSRKVCLKSWDGFQIPMPFSACEIILNTPMFVPRDADDTGREELRLELEATLLSLSKD